MDHDAILDLCTLARQTMLKLCGSCVVVDTEAEFRRLGALQNRWESSEILSQRTRENRAVQETCWVVVLGCVGRVELL